MYIDKILSNLGAWNSFRRDYPDLYNEVSRTIEAIQPLRSQRSINRRDKGKMLISAPDLNRQFDAHIGNYGWSKRRILFGSDTGSGFSEIDAIKEKIGLEISFGKFAFVESDLFVKFPIFIRSEIINLAILIMPMKVLAKEIAVGVSNFEMIERRLREISPLLPRYPFAIVGVNHEPCEPSIAEFSSQLDQFLIKTIGSTYLDLKLNLERPNCDFKEDLPPQPERVAKHLCALANLRGGGLLLIGLDDNGDIRGILRENLDEKQSRISRISHSSVNPVPDIQFHIIEIVDNPGRCILAVQVNEILRKPCVANERVYIRSGSQSIAANSEDIRKLLLGSGM